MRYCQIPQCREPARLKATWKSEFGKVRRVYVCGALCAGLANKHHNRIFIWREYRPDDRSNDPPLI